MNVNQLVSLVTLVGLLSPVALHAQSTRDRLAALEASVQRLERLLENNQTIQTDLLQRIQALQEENQALRNDVEQLQFEQKQGSDRQRQLYLDLDSRLQALESGAADGTVADTTTNAVTDTAAYQAAFGLLKSGRYDEAQSAFASFLATYPDSPMRGNAQYWLAETYYVTKAFDTALREFQKVIAEYPTTRKIPDAWLKVGYCNYELQQWDQARQALDIVVTRYSDSTAARLAEKRLAQMRSEGH